MRIGRFKSVFDLYGDMCLTHIERFELYKGCGRAFSSARECAWPPVGWRLTGPLAAHCRKGMLGSPLICNVCIYINIFLYIIYLTCLSITSEAGHIKEEKRKWAICLLRYAEFSLGRSFPRVPRLIGGAGSRGKTARFFATFRKKLRNGPKNVGKKARKRAGKRVFSS